MDQAIKRTPAPGAGGAGSPSPRGGPAGRNAAPAGSPPRIPPPGSANALDYIFLLRPMILIPVWTFFLLGARHGNRASGGSPDPVTFAAGLAREGFKPFVAIYSTFLQRSLDQIIHDVALQNLPVRFIIDRAGIVGEDGPTHHGTFDLSYLSLVPGMTVMAPADENEMSRMMASMGVYGAGPSAMRFPRGSVAGVPAADADEPLKMGEGRIVRNGLDAALISIGSMLTPAMEASHILAGHGLDVAVADARFLKPLDHGLIRELSSNGRRIFTVEENSVRGGFGDAIMDCLSAMDIQANVTKLGIADGFVPHGAREELLEEQGLTAEAIARTVLGRIHSGSKAGHGGVA